MNQGRLWTIIAGIWIILIFLLNISYFASTDAYLGADVHYYVGLSHLVEKGIYDINPYFLEEKNIYPIGTNFILLFLSSQIDLSIQFIWRLYVPIFSLLFLIFLFLFVKRISNSVTASISTILISCWKEILWPDPGVRLFAWFILVVSLFLFTIYLQNKNKGILFLSQAFALFLLWIHTEIFIHLLIIYFVFFILKKTSILNRLIIKQKLDYNRTFLILTLLIFLGIMLFLTKSLLSFSEIGSALIYNEVPLSLFYPFGVISLFICILAIPPFLKILNQKKSDKELLVISIIFLISNSLFYFTHLWQFHHRYFSETGFIAIIILCALNIKGILQTQKRKVRKIFIIIMFFLIIISIYPRYEFMNYYTSQTQDNFQRFAPLLADIKNLTEFGSVIAIHPDSILNRYIPSYSERFVLGAVGTINKERQWEIITTGCVVIINKKNICEIRENKTRILFENFSEETLNLIRQDYKVDYILSEITSNITINLQKKSDLYENKTYLGGWVLFKLVPQNKTALKIPNTLFLAPIT